MQRWVEGADWIVWKLCGHYRRNVCSAGYKGIRQNGRYPSEEFLALLNPDFRTFVNAKLDQPIAALGERVGNLTPEAARWTGLPVGIAVAAGNVDAHVTAPAANAVEPGQMVAIMGTSTCHVMNGEQCAEVPGMCGVVDGGNHGGAVGLRSWSVRSRRYLRLVHEDAGAADIFRRSPVRGLIPPRVPDQTRHLATGGRTWAGSSGLALWQPIGTRGSRTVRRRGRTDARHEAGGHLPGSPRGDCLWDAADHRGVQRIGRSRK